MHLSTEAVPDPARRLRMRWGAALALGCTALLGLLLTLVRGGWTPLARLDHGWVTSLHAYATAHTAWTASLQTLTDLGGPVAMRGLLAVAALWLFAIGARALAGWVAVQLVAGWVVGWAVKAAVDRPRPHFDNPVSHAGGSAFPSGHALASAITCTVVAALIWPQANRAGRVATAGAAALTALTVGWTRIALGVHWPTDVAAGWLTAGALVGAATVAFELWLPGALAADMRRVTWRSRPRVQRVLVSPGPPPGPEHRTDADG